MLLASVQFVFALIFGYFCWLSLPRARVFLRSGWTILQAAAKREDAQNNIEAHRNANVGLRFLFAGIFWSIATLLSAGLTLYFLIQTAVYAGILPS